MKDLDMTDRNERFLRAKAALDKVIREVNLLAGEAEKESLVCCKEDQLDARDDLGAIAAHLRTAQGALWLARARAGQINSGGITRSGGT